MEAKSGIRMAYPVINYFNLNLVFFFAIHFSVNSCIIWVADCFDRPISVATAIVSARAGSPLPFMVVVW